MLQSTKKLKNDVISNIKKDKKDVVYAKAGDNVIIISDCDNALIVENKNGERFPCSPNDLTEAVIKENPVTDLKPITHKVQAIPAKRQKPAPLKNNQSQLF